MMKDFDLDNLERKNIFKVSDDMFENIQAKVLDNNSSSLDIDCIERKNIYKKSHNLFEEIQNNVLKEIKVEKKAPIFNLKWTYAVAASLALLFGSAYLYNTNDTNGLYNAKAYAVTTNDKTESEVALETLENDLTSVENNNHKEENGSINTIASIPEKKEVKKIALKPVLKQTEAQMVEYLDSFTSSEIEDLATNSTQDVYLDLYN
ncbi:hypothetical protein [Chryseobacterium sp.]|uniref:hypothetical protein n=1 Tax=Chryseobacterium sp. TaxID=1871047 RepID=UPI00388D42DA